MILPEVGHSMGQGRHSVFLVEQERKSEGFNAISLALAVVEWRCVPVPGRAVQLPPTKNP